MNINPINFTHFNSVNNNKKDKVQKTGNTEQKTSINLQNKVTSDVFKAYNPQISFTRRALNKEGQENIVSYLSSKPNYNGHSVAQTLALKKPQRYIEVTSNLSNQNKYKLLKLQDSFGNTTAHALAKKGGYLYTVATNGANPKEKYNLLKLANRDKTTVAHNLAYYYPYVYIEATEDLDQDDMLRVLKLKDREGTTVADNLAYSNPDLYAEEMEYFAPEERLEIIQFKDKDEPTTAHRAIYTNENTYRRSTNGFSREVQFELFSTGNIASSLAFRDVELYKEITRNFTDKQKGYLIEQIRSIKTNENNRDYVQRIIKKITE